MATQPPTSISWPLTLFPATLGTSFRFRPSIPLLLSASRRIAAAIAASKNTAKLGTYWLGILQLSSRAEHDGARRRRATEGEAEGPCVCSSCRPKTDDWFF